MQKSDVFHGRVMDAVAASLDRRRVNSRGCSPGSGSTNRRGEECSAVHMGFCPENITSSTARSDSRPKCNLGGDAIGVINHSPTEMPVKELADFVPGGGSFGSIGRKGILRVRLPFEYQQFRHAARLE